MRFIYIGKKTEILELNLRNVQQKRIINGNTKMVLSKFGFFYRIQEPKNQFYFEKKYNSN